MLIYIVPSYDGNGADRSDHKQHVKLSNELNYEQFSYIIGGVPNIRFVRWINWILFYLKTTLLILYHSTKAPTSVFSTCTIPYLSYAQAYLCHALRIRYVCHIHRTSDDCSELTQISRKCHFLFVTEEIIAANIRKHLNCDVLCLNYFNWNEDNDEINHVFKKYDISYIGSVRREKGILNFLRLQEILPNASLRILGKCNDHELDKLVVNRKRAQLDYVNTFLNEKEFFTAISETKIVALLYSEKEYKYRGSSMIYDLVRLRTAFISYDFGVFNFYAKKFNIGITVDHIAENPEVLTKFNMSKCDFEGATEYLKSRSLKRNYDRFRDRLEG